MNKEQVCNLLFNNNKNKYIMVNYAYVYNVLSTIENTDSGWETLREHSSKNKVHKKDLEPGYYCSDCGGYSPIKTKYCPHCGLYKGEKI